MSKANKLQIWLVFNLSEDTHLWVRAISPEKAIKEYLNQTKEYFQDRNLNLLVYPDASAVKKLVTVKTKKKISIKYNKGGQNE